MATRTAVMHNGDDGISRFAGVEVHKNSPEIMFTGAVDAVHAKFDTARLHIDDRELADFLKDLKVRFGKLAAVMVGYSVGYPQGGVFTKENMELIDREIDRIKPGLPQGFASFNTPAGCALNEARVEVRNLETMLVAVLKSGEWSDQGELRINKEDFEQDLKFINRLSLYLWCVAGEQDMKAAARQERRGLKKLMRFGT